MTKSWIRFGAVIVLTLVSVSARAGEVEIYGEGWKETVNGYPVLHLKGSEFEMGKQYGFLAGDLMEDNIKNITEIARSKKKWFKFVPRGVFVGIKRMLGRMFWKTYSKDTKESLLGIVAGAAERDRAIRLNKYDIAFLNAIVDLAGIFGAKFGEDSRPFTETQVAAVLRELEIPAVTNNCDTVAVFGSRTIGGKTFQSRNADVDTGLGLEKHPVVLIFKRPGKIPVAATTFAGMIGVISGMNAEGLALGQVWAFSMDAKIDTPWQLRMREVFMDAHTAGAAVEILRRRPTTTYGTNFVLADGKGGAFAIEMSAANFDVFGPNDPRELELKFEGESVGLPLREAALRGDLTVSPKLRARQTAARGPTGDPRVSQAYKRRYLGLYERVIAYEQNGILMGHAELETISRETAMAENLQNVVYANTDRDLWLTVAQMQPDGSVIQAKDRPYEHIPFSKYLTDIEVDSGAGKLRLTSWLEAGHALSAEQLTLVREDVASAPVITSLTVGELIAQTATGGHVVSGQFNRGETYALRMNDGTLVERVIVK